MRNAAATRRSCQLLVDDEFDRVACDCDLDWIRYVRSAAAFADEDFVDEYDEAAETAIVMIGREGKECGESSQWSVVRGEWAAWCQAARDRNYQKTLIVGITRGTSTPSNG